MNGLEVHDHRILETVAEDAEVVKVADGFAFLEGPVWDHRNDRLIFSDIAGNRMHQWSSNSGISVFRDPSNMANGNAFDAQARLITCEHATSRLVRDDGSDGSVVLASHFDGKELNSPNDVVVKSDQSIYFTDPASGRMEFWGIPRDRELEFCGVYRVDSDGKNLSLLADDFEIPNGLCFSLDESALFVNDTRRRHIRRFDVAIDGSLMGGEVWAELGGGEGDRPPDGMKIDSRETLFCVGPGGVHLFDMEAERLGVIHVPEDVANFAWGGNDLQTLFITASTSLYRVDLRVPGLPAY